MNTLTKFVFYSCSVLLHVFPWTSQAFESHTFHIVDANAYLSTPNVCNSAFTTGSENKRSATLKIVDKFSPCFSHKARNKPSLHYILSRDLSRVDSIHKLGQSKLDSARSYRPILSPESFNASNYVVTIGLGTPEQQVSFLFRTSADFLFVQCAPLYTGKEEAHYFNSTASSTFSYIKCDAPECNELAPDLDCSADKYCDRDATEDGDSFPASFTKDSLTLITPTDVVFQDFVFGCTESIPELEGNVIGILGFSRNNFSFVSQTKTIYNQVFSYCLPPNPSQFGFLRFGDDMDSNTKLTDLVNCPPFLPSSYCIDITAITVGGVQLQINGSVFESSGAIIDSDTTFTYLPPDAYTQLRTAFKQQMTSYKVAPSFYKFDTCYDTSKSAIINIPTVSFTIGDVTVDLNPFGILVPNDNSTVSCLAFIENSYPDTMTIFGSTQQKGLKVMYDVGRGKIGFGQGDCFKL